MFHEGCKGGTDHHRLCGMIQRTFLMRVAACRLQRFSLRPECLALPLLAELLKTLTHLGQGEATDAFLRALAQARLDEGVDKGFRQIGEVKSGEMRWRWSLFTESGNGNTSQGVAAR